MSVYVRRITNQARALSSNPEMSVNEKEREHVCAVVYVSECMREGARVYVLHQKQRFPQL